jgi:hypothetical protein
VNQVEYVFDAEEHLIRAGEIIYSYFEDGYSEFLGSFEKMTYHFLENGYLAKRIFFQKIHEDGEWFQKEMWETEYGYKDDNPNNPNGNVMLETASRKVYGMAGAIMIHSDKPETVWIYSVSGLFIRYLQTVPGSQSIFLPKGFYIVVADNQIYKVIVR